MTTKPGGWDTKTELTQGERAVLRRAVGKVVRNIFEREKNGTKRRLLCDYIGSQAFHDSAQSSVYAREAERRAKLRGKRKTKR